MGAKVLHLAQIRQKNASSHHACVSSCRYGGRKSRLRFLRVLVEAIEYLCTTPAPIPNKNTTGHLAGAKSCIQVAHAISDRISQQEKHLNGHPQKPYLRPMQPSFLHILVQRLLARHGAEISSICIIVPSRRAVAFLREELAASVPQTLWAPKILALQDFIREESGLQFPEPLTLIFELYEVYQAQLKQHAAAHGGYRGAETFDQFYAWGEMLLRDFDEADRYLADVAQLFSNIRDLKAIDEAFGLPEESKYALRQFWGTLTPGPSAGDELLGPEGTIQDRFLRIWQMLYAVYTDFQAALSAKKLAYDGMAYRDIAGRAKSETLILPYSHVVFAGFNALSKAEEVLMGNLLAQGTATVYWDADVAFFDKEKQQEASYLFEEAGKFVRFYHTRWKDKGSFLLTTDILGIGSQPSGSATCHEKTITMTAVPANVAQAHYLGNLLANTGMEAGNFRQHAVVLGDEALLFPVLYALPAHVSTLNITMGFPLKHTDVYSLLMDTLRLLRLLKADEGKVRFTHREVLAILNNRYVKHLAGGHSERLKRRILQENQVFVPQETLLAEPKGLPAFLQRIFSPPVAYGPDLLAYFDELFDLLLTDAQAQKAYLETEYIFHLFTHFNRLKSVLARYRAALNLAGFTRIFRDTLQGARIPFEGEPLLGVQVMGFLETRTLDFDSLYIIGCNEGLLPSTTRNNTFIPHNLRRGFGLPTHEEQDAIIAYHFFRLLLRARNIHLLYNANVQDSGGEMSRFIRQINYFLRDIPHIRLVEETVGIATPAPPIVPITEDNTPEARKRLLERFGGEKYFSATALSSYLSCKLQFYFRYVAGIKEPAEVEETLETNTFGSVLHETMEALYTPWVGKMLSATEIIGLKKHIQSALQEAWLRNNVADNGQNSLFKTVIERLCEKLLDKDAALAPFTLTSLEASEFARTLAGKVGENTYEVHINGKFDRVDTLENGAVRIVDYKTGSKIKEALKLAKQHGLDVCFTDHNAKEAFQGYLYAWLHAHKQPDTPVQVGFYAVRTLSEGIQFLNDGNPIDAATLADFQRQLEQLVQSIFSAPFSQTPDTKVCAYCAFKQICQR